MKQHIRPVIQVNMLGEFSLSVRGRKVSDGGTRSHKVWLLLAYMIHNRDRTVTQEELYQLLWPNEGASSNPANALKTMLHRVRSVLDGLGADMGHMLIVRSNNIYSWDKDVPVSVDVDRFVAACRQAEQETDAALRLDKTLEAISLYQGDFLEKLAVESWVIPLSVQYHKMFLDAVQYAIPALLESRCFDRVEALCARAIRLEPYHEPFYCALMRAQIALGKRGDAISTYKNMSELLLANFGVMPSEESKELYRKANRDTGDRVLDMEMLREQLCVSDVDAGALVCDYDFFRAIYSAVSRSLSRNGDASHIVLLSVCPKGKALTQRSLRCCMDNLEALLCAGLRRGDILARCSASQYVLLLPRANYENSTMICERIIANFSRQYPHSSAYLQASVQPLLPPDKT